MTSSIATDWNPSVRITGVDYAYLGGSLDALNKKIEDCKSKEWMLGGCILGFVAPQQSHPLTEREYRLQAWLLFRLLYPEVATKLLDVMKEATGKTI